MKKTKIICTIGPASEHIDTMRDLIKSGMNVVRMNFSHGGYEEQGARIVTTRKLNKELKTNVALLLDTQGPEIRTHLFPEGKVTVVKGSEVRISMKEIPGNATRFSVTYPGLYDDVAVGGIVLVDDGYLALEVTAKDKKHKELVCVAKNTHKIKDKRGINVPGVELHMPFISEKDKADIQFAADQDLDFIAASFVRRPADIIAIKEILAERNNTNIKIIAKIENQEGVDNLDGILEIADGIMVARGDLGVEVPAEEVPFIQKDIINKCHFVGKIVVVATQMLESMQQNPRPTRAEVNDVANAVLDGTDATMLSGESAGGDYPVESVKYMARIDGRTEQGVDYESAMALALSGILECDLMMALGMSAARMALEFGAIAIVTEGSAEAAKAVSRFRPCVSIVAAVKTTQEARGLALNYAVNSIVGDAKDAIELVKKDHEYNKGDFIIVVSEDTMKYIKL